jgi:hypothetical protein
MPSRTRLRSGDAAALGFTTIAARLQDMVVSHSEPQRATASHSEPQRGHSGPTACRPPYVPWAHQGMYLYHCAIMYSQLGTDSTYSTHRTQRHT